jgi:hypothetical protein
MSPKKRRRMMRDFGRKLLPILAAAALVTGLVIAALRSQWLILGLIAFGCVTGSISFFLMTTRLQRVKEQASALENKRSRDAEEAMDEWRDMCDRFTMDAKAMIAAANLLWESRFGSQDGDDVCEELVHRVITLHLRGLLYESTVYDFAPQILEFYLPGYHQPKEEDAERLRLWLILQEAAKLPAPLLSSSAT